jgi:hypothetical protein
MYPWLWLWAPQIHWPLSNFSQDIAPVTDWAFGIPPNAGDAQIEKEAVQVASYGRQLGLISEVLLAQAGSDRVDGKKAAQSLKRLEGIYGRIEETKKKVRLETREALIAQLQNLRESDREAFAYVVQRLGATVPAA